jgi:shikimate dehydrogenase
VKGSDPKPNRLAVLGSPISHSRSPAIHNAAFDALGLADQWSYEAIEVAAGEFPAMVGAMPGEGFVGANVTVPHKRAALEVAEQRSEVAAEIGAANTLSFEAGSIRADNTDAEGLISALPQSVSGRQALVLGAGGAARAAVWALLGEGAVVAVWNRTPARAAELCSQIGGTTVGDPQLEDFEVIVNSTAAGLGGEDPFAALPLAADSLRSAHTLVDLAYGDAETALVRAAREAGATVVDGIEILVQQGAASFRIWTGAEPPLDVMRAAARGIATDT